MQFKLNVAIIAAAIAVTSVTAVPTYYNSNDVADLAARSTVDDLAYLEARYSSEIDASNFFAREFVEPEPAATFSRREVDDTMNDLVARGNFFKDLFARKADSLSSKQVMAFGLMKQMCEKVEDKKQRRKCVKIVENLATLTGEAHWGFRNYLKVTGATEIPAGVEVDLASIVAEHAKGCKGDSTHDDHHSCTSGSTSTSTLSSTSTSTSTSSAAAPPSKTT